MDKRQKSSGQTLVELALVLPVLVLLVFAGFLIVATCVNLVVLQTKVFQTARTVSKHQTSFPGLLGLSLWGRARLPTLKRSSQTFQPWRPFKRVYAPPLPVISTIHTPGYLVQMHLKSTLWPGLGITRMLPTVPLHVSAETILEPDPPSEQ